MSEPITKDWLGEVGFRVIENPDRRKRQQCTKYVRGLPFHLLVNISYFEYPKHDCRDGLIVSTATFGGGPLRIPSALMKSREQLCDLIKCLSGVNLLEPIE